MADLATQADLVARLGRALNATEAAKAPALLADASALVRRHTRQDFELVEDDVVLLRPVGDTVRLPQRPVVAVSSVVAVGCGGHPDLTLAVDEWCWDGADKVEIGVIYRESDNPWWRLWYGHVGPDTYRVTYDHGYATIPPDVVAVVCGMVLRTMTSPTPVEGLTAERIGQYGYQYAQFPGGQSPGASVKLTQADKDTLADAGYKRRSGTVQVST